MEPQVNYDQRYGSLVTVYRFGSFAAAAAEMKLTASAVAKQIHSLERDLDRPLFIRSGKRLLPTRVCEAIIPFTERIDALCARMRQEIAATDRSVRCLVVGVTPSAESSAVSQVLTRYSAGHGDIQVTIVTESSAALHDMLQAGAIDLAVVDGGFDAEGFNSILLDTDYFVAAVANDNPLAQKSIIHLSDLRSERLILRTPGSGTRDLFEAHLKSAGIQLAMFKIMMELDSISTIKKLVESNYGVSVLPNKVCARDAEAGHFTIKPIADMNMARQIHMFYRPEFRGAELLGDMQKLYYEVMSE